MGNGTQVVPACEGLYVISSNPDNLAAHLSQFEKTATVEAEYGDRLVEGSVLSLAHHGSRSANPAPCNATVPADLSVDCIGVSHIDLDTIGGVAAITNDKPDAPSFWQLAEYVDVNGVHKLSESGASDEDLGRLYAWYAWSSKNRYFPPRDGSVANATEFVLKAIDVLADIIDGDVARLKDGEEFKDNEAKVNRESFLEISHGLVVRCAPTFVNHLYVSPDGEVGDAVVAFNPINGAVTISYADATGDQSAIDALQAVFTDTDDEGNPLAGGHKGIGGSPRNRRATFAEFVDSVIAVKKQLC
jgi:hypothetical protein